MKDGLREGRAVLSALQTTVGPGKRKKSQQNRSTQGSGIRAKKSRPRGGGLE